MVDHGKYNAVESVAKMLPICNSSSQEEMPCPCCVKGDFRIEVFLPIPFDFQASQIVGSYAALSSRAALLYFRHEGFGVSKAVLLVQWLAGLAM